MTTFVIVLFCILALLSAILPPSYMMLGVGLFIFTHPLRGPDSIPLNFLSHVPTTVQLDQIRATRMVLAKLPLDSSAPT
jgi:hypothetical protein